MDKIYAPIDKRWVTEKINLKEEFRAFKGEISSFFPSVGSTLEETMSKVFNGNIDENLAKESAQSCNLDKLSGHCDIPTEIVRKDTDENACVELPLTEEGISKLATLQILSKSRPNNQKDAQARPVVLPNRTKRFTSIKVREDKDVAADLKPYQHSFLTIRVYHPFKQNYGAKKKHGPILSQVVNVLGEQTLAIFRDMIFCVNDYAVPGDRSQNLDENLTTTNKEIYPSGFFFIENVFYNDMRNLLSKDYSTVIEKWLQSLPGEVDSVSSKTMDSVKFEDLSIRFGYPYVYVHQGSCEHLIVFSDGRLLSPSDSLLASDYPLLVYLYKKSTILCNFCGHFVALWIVHSCDRIPYKIVHLCKRCLKMYCYKNEKKIGNFYLYEYIDPSSILHAVDQ